MAQPRILYLLSGPTAVGKTALALDWAEQNNAEIVSCDSLLFYRGMDIGTAKPSATELRRVPHHCIDIADVSKQLNIQEYIHVARAAIDGIISRERKVLLVGGSGFYLKTFWATVTDNVDVSPELRFEIDTMLQRYGLPALLEKLRSLCPEGLGALDTANPRRVTRALERCISSGKSLAQLTAAFANTPSAFADFETKITILSRSAEDLQERIEQRVHQMLSDGLIDEVRNLEKIGLRKNPSAAQAIGYREVLAYFDGKLSEASLAGEIIKNTRALARKQRTWFRTQLPLHAVVDTQTTTAASLFP